MNADPEISVVIPFHNEQDNAAATIAEVVAVLTEVGRPFEIVLVDDGSDDRTPAVLTEAAESNPACVVLRHPANLGQAAALWNGLHRARGTVLVTLDGDGQNDPADLPAMLARLTDVDLVQGVRTNRHDTPLRIAMSRIANGVRRRWLQDGAHDAGCALRVFRRDVLGSLIPIRTLYSFIPFAVVSAGYRMTEHPVRHRPRRAGESHYGLRRMWWRPCVDMIAIRWFGRRRIAPPAWGDAIVGQAD